MMSNTGWTIVLEEDESGELILPLPPDLLEQAGWVEGDTIIWSVQEDGSILLSKKR
jgi:antitoxin component of MazEF toxin-antitoxin module